MGASAGRLGDVCGVCGDARADNILHWQDGAFVQDYVVLPPPWIMLDGGDRVEEGGERPVAIADGGVGTVDHCVCFGDVLLAVPAGDRPMPGGS